MANGGKREGAGRKKGVPNKINADIKQMLLEALSEAGGKAYFLRQAEENPTSFNTLIAKIIPAEVKQELTGNINISKITREIVNANDKDA